MVIKVKPAMKEPRRMRIPRTGKVLVEGLVCATAISCGGRYGDPDASHHRPDASADSGADAGHDAMPDGCIGVEVACPTVTESRENLEIRMGGSADVGGLRITAEGNDGARGIITIQCAETGELYASEAGLPLNEERSFEADTAQARITCYGILGGMSLFLSVSVESPCTSVY